MVEFRAWDTIKKCYLNMDELLFVHIGSYESILGEILSGNTNRYILEQASDYTLTDGRRVFEGDKFSVENDKGETVVAVCERGMARRTIMGNEVDISCFYFRVDAYEGKKTFPIVNNYAGVHDLSMFRYIGTVHDEEVEMEEFLECEYCGKKDESVERTIDPFEQEVNNEVLWVNLCKDCHTNRAEGA